MVRHRRLLVGGRLGGADVHPPVDLHGIDRDDFHVAQHLGGGESHGRLPRGSGPDEGQVGDAFRIGSRHEAETGIRTRRPGSAVLRTNVPRRKWGAAESIVTSANAPGRNPPAAGVSGARKWTSLFWRVRPVVMVASFLDGPSIKTSSTLPTRAS